MHVVPHRPTRTSVVLWVQAEAFENDWSLVVRGTDGSTREWAPGGAAPERLPNVTALLPATRVWMPQFTDLAPATDHTAYFVTARGGETRAATFRTLPEDLARPFSVLLASCYSEQDDLPPNRFWDLLTSHDAGVVAGVAQRLLRSVRKVAVTLRSVARTGLPEVEPRGTVSRCYRDLVEAEGEPDLKILCGDQVYVDDPIWHFLVPRGPWWIAKHLSDTYSRTWDRLGWFLSRGGNVFTSDDHEFWNNFPTTPSAWPALWLDRFQDAWRERAQQFLRWVQDPQPVWRADLAEVSFLVADTRMNRGEPEGGRFMRDEDFATLVGWVTALDRPGVLVVTQPLIAQPGDPTTDYGLPAYAAQYAALCEALARCPHDVLVLTGDIHYGRLATVELPAAGDVPAHRYVELVSSPTAALLRHPGSFSSTEEAPARFPDPEVVPAAATRGTVAFTETVPTVDGERCADHFVMLTFERGGEPGTVSVGVRVVLPDGQPEGQPAVPPPGPILLRTARETVGRS